MGSRLLCCVVLCLLGAGPMDAEITQMPRYGIIQTGTKRTLECSQDMNHFAMFWYRQDPGQGPRLIYYSSGSPSTTKGDVTEGYNISRKEQTRFPLTLESASTNQTSVYLCASSESTAGSASCSLHKKLSRKQWRLLPEASPHDEGKTALTEAFTQR
ncbi:unnamed protein product [Gulo gulo]|uniref:Ig-like domain-containing protein n=1 Tax=Gulo gulo TaxID=48420 RepID=A0A9X9LW35_GULGU|nr:unnamed protein product [Gulo gulo]